jgi:hypothetical protein
MGLVQYYTKVSDFHGKSMGCSTVLFIYDLSEQ